MIYDFRTFWTIGQAFLQGQPVYQMSFWYPFPLIYPIALVSLLPLVVGYILITALSIFVLFKSLGRTAVYWFLFVPIVSILFSGSLDILFWGLERKMKGQWYDPILAAVITLKPQIAVILLPHHFRLWSKKRFATFGICLTALYGLPLLWYPHWIQDWLNALHRAPAGKPYQSPGIWVFNEPFWLSLFISILIVLWSWKQEKNSQRAGLILACPFGLGYNLMTLTDAGPWYILVPLSWLATIIALQFKILFWFPLVPLSIIFLTLRTSSDRIQKLV